MEIGIFGGDDKREGEGMKWEEKNQEHYVSPSRGKERKKKREGEREKGRFLWPTNRE